MLAQQCYARFGRECGNLYLSPQIGAEKAKAAEWNNWWDDVYNKSAASTQALVIQNDDGSSSSSSDSDDDEKTPLLKSRDQKSVFDLTPAELYALCSNC